MKLKISWKIILLCVFLIAIIAVSAVYSSYRRQIIEANNQITRNTLIEISADKSSKQVGLDLASLGLVKNAEVFYLYERISGDSITPGFYEITPNMSIKDIADLFDSGKTKEVRVTIPEGHRLEQIGQKLALLGVVSYSEFIAAAKGYEGKLFPDTYFMNPRMTGAGVVKMMNAAYLKRTADLILSDQNLIIASIVEKEAANDADRGVIAGIYLNRVKAGMKLQSDPTVSYARDSLNVANMTSSGVEDYVFWKPAKTVEFTSVISLFNTYQSTGLPPAPICNPGLASIQAVLSPTASNYYYFLYGSDGKIHPAKTQAEHNVNVARYL